LGPFEKIYAENYQVVFRVAKKMLGDDDEASDIAQEVFICLFHRFQNGNDVQYPKSWLYRTALNKCIDKQRYNGRFQKIESIGDGKGEEQNMASQEISAAIHAALSKLKPQEKMLAVLYSEGLSYKGISEATGIKFSSIGKMLSRTLKKLEKELKTQRYELH
jgi:RNA polymerase sigma-70 factor (ECF subfamily)